MGITHRRQEKPRGFDIGYCGEPGTGCPAATTGVSLNGVTLTRQVPAALGCVGLAYHVSADGAVTP